MNKDLLQTNILEAIKEKIPNKSSLANMLSSVLCIEREAVYRRLRGEVVFTFYEIALIANVLGISLDNIISSTFSEKSRPFQLKLVNYFDSTEKDYAMMEQYNALLREGKNDPKSEIMDCTNVLPQIFYQGYRYVERLHLFKSIYQSGNTNTIRNLKEVDYSERTAKIVREYVRLAKNFKTAYYIFDPFLFQYIVNDIIYFNSINMIEEDDKENLKNDLLAILNDMEELAGCGEDKDTGNKVYLYVGSVNFNLSYSFVDINNFHISLIKVFVLNNFASLDEDSFTIVKARSAALLRSSTMISISGERQRRLFFDKQREIVNTL